MQYRAILAELKAHADPANVAGMARFGINPRNTLGLSMPFVREMARRIGRDHLLAQRLWDSGIHEARILAALIDDPALVTAAQLERWVKDFDSWDVCDQCCSSLFDKTRFGYRKAAQWSRREEEFVKRAGFVLMAALAVHDRAAGDQAFESFLPLILECAEDERNFVKKAVNWALRQIGKRNKYLNRHALATARRLQATGSRAARWIASDALRELTSDAVQRKWRG